MRRVRFVIYGTYSVAHWIPHRDNTGIAGCRYFTIHVGSPRWGISNDLFDPVT